MERNMNIKIVYGDNELNITDEQYAMVVRGLTSLMLRYGTSQHGRYRADAVEMLRDAVSGLRENAQMQANQGG